MLTVIPLWFMPLKIERKGAEAFKVVTWGVYENRSLVALGQEMVSLQKEAEEISALVNNYTSTRSEEYFEVYEVSNGESSKLRDPLPLTLNNNAYQSTQTLYQRLAHRMSYRSVRSFLNGYTFEILSQMIATTVNEKWKRLGEPSKAERATPLIIATDGSYHPRHGGASYAWVDEQGRYETGLVKGNNIGLAELIAIRQALLKARGYAQLIILTDSKAAIRYITEPASNDISRIRVVAETVRELATKFESVAYSWVKGHNGEPLNEAADALARQRRTAKSNHVTPEVLAQIEANIVASALEKRKPAA